MTLKRTIGVPLARLVFRPSLMHLAERYLRIYYRWDTIRRWQLAEHPPEWFDHRSDLYRFSERRAPYWAERGIFARELMSEGCRVLDLCCGDGFIPYHFYSELAVHVDACDRDPTALEHARRYHAHPRIVYSRRDVVADPFPGGGYDVVTWDAAIEHFSLDAIDTVLRKIRAAMMPGGALVGYTILNAGDRMHPDHEHEFRDARELAATIGRHFPHVATLETHYPDRRNVYFRAANEPGRLGGFRDPR
jgi:SAM-dependent methyltransferase